MRVVPSRYSSSNKEAGAPQLRFAAELAIPLGFDAFLQTETGEHLASLEDSQGLLSRLIQRGEFDSTMCLRFIDPCGDAAGNHLQAAILVVELRAAQERAELTTRDHIDALVALEDQRFVTRQPGTPDEGTAMLRAVEAADLR